MKQLTANPDLMTHERNASVLKSEQFALEVL